MKNLRIYKLGDTYKYVLTDLVNKNFFDDCEKHKNVNINNNEKYFNNILRAKTEIKNLILCNDFKYFVTLTFNSNFNRYNLQELKNKVNNKIRKLRKQTGLPFCFLFIPEEHKKGGWHLHGLFDSSISDYLYINENGFLDCLLFDYFGYNSISQIENKEKVSSYVTKYVTKDFAKREKGQHLFFASQNLKRPVLIDDIIVTNNLKNGFFDYTNEFCSIKYDIKYYNLKNILTARIL